MHSLSSFIFRQWRHGKEIHTRICIRLNNNNKLFVCVYSLIVIVLMSACRTSNCLKNISYAWDVLRFSPAHTQKKSKTTENIACFCQDSIAQYSFIRVLNTFKSYRWRLWFSVSAVKIFLGSSHSGCNWSINALEILANLWLTRSQHGVAIYVLQLHPLSFETPIIIFAPRLIKINF